MTHLPPALQKLESTYMENVLTGDGWTARNKVFDVLDAAHKKHRRNKSTLVQKQLVKHWLHHYKFHLRKTKHGLLPIKPLDLFFDYLTRHNIMRSLALHSEDKQLIACLCMLRSRDMKGSHHRSKTVLKLLENWSGKNLSTLKPSLENTVELLYGAACWSLFISEVRDVKELPIYLWRQQLPLLMNDEGDPQRFETTLPVNLL